jgi:DNA-binding NtrC family response regulator
VSTSPSAEVGAGDLGETGVGKEFLARIVHDSSPRRSGPFVRKAIAQTGGNRTQAAKLLGVSRNGLAIMMARLGIE